METEKPGTKPDTWIGEVGVPSSDFPCLLTWTTGCRRLTRSNMEIFFVSKGGHAKLIKVQ